MSSITTKSNVVSEEEAKHALGSLYEPEGPKQTLSASSAEFVPSGQAGTSRRRRRHHKKSKKATRKARKTRRR